MVRLSDPLPYEIIHRGRVIRLTPSFDNVLKMYTAVEGELLPFEQLDIMLYYLTAEGTPREYEILQAVSDAIFPPAKTSGENTKVFDFVQDAPFIYASFMQAYHIDLFDVQGILHWWKFLALLAALPSETQFKRVVEIRAKDIPAANKHNAKEIQELLRLKALYRLQTTEEERIKSFNGGLQKMAAYMEATAKE